METARSKLVDGGRIVVPAAFRRAMGLANGDAVILELHGDELRVRPARAALRRLQARLASSGTWPGRAASVRHSPRERRREAAGA